MKKGWMDFKDNIDIRRELDRQLLEPLVENRIAIQGLTIYVRIPTIDFNEGMGIVPNELLKEELTYDTGITWDIYYSQECIVYPEWTYVAIDRTNMSKLDPRKNSNYRHYSDSISNELFWSWINWSISMAGGTENIFIILPILDNV